MATMKRGRSLSPDEEKDLARRIIAAERTAFDACWGHDVTRPFLKRRRKGSERTRAGDVDALGKAVEALGTYAKTDPAVRPDARVARGAWEHAESMRWELAMSATRIAWGEARKLAGAFMELEDLAQEGFVGLLRAAKRFDPERNIRFTTYARWWVRAQMTRAVDTTGRTVRLPGCAVEQTRNLRKAMVDFDRLGSDWTVADLAAEVGIETERAEFLLSRGPTVSLDEPLDDGPRSRSVASLLADDDAENPSEAAIFGQEVQHMLDAAASLDDRQRFVITKRYGLEDAEFRSLSSIAREMDLSRERVRQLEKEALETMRRAGIREMAAA